MRTKRTITNLVLGIGLVIALMGVPHVASAQKNVIYQVCVALDGSDSINASEFNLQITGLARAISDPAVVPQNGTVELGVVQFGRGDARIEVPATVIDSPATAAAVSATIQATIQKGGNTPLAAGVSLCTAQITGSSHFDTATRQVINVSTDGHPSGTGEPTATWAARGAAVAAGVDELDAEAIGRDADIGFLAALVHPQPATLVPPDSYSPGFVRIVGSFADFEAAMREKLGTVIGSVPKTSLGTIRGTVFKDSNCNGIRDPDESTLPGITFDLRSPAGVLVDGWTGDDGTYGPAGLTPCDYWIDLHVPPDYVATTPTMLGLLAVNGNAITDQDFGLARPEWCSTPSETTTSSETTIAPPPFLPVTGSRSVVGNVLTTSGLLALMVGLWLGRRGRT